MTRRFWFVTVSLVAHAAAGVAIFAAGIWDIERLERDRRQLPSLAAMMPPPPAAGGGLNLPEQTVKRKEPPKRVVTEIVQPPPPKPPDDKPTTVVETGPGTDGPSKGPGPGGPDDDGTCMTPPCGSGPLEPQKREPPPPKPKPPEIVLVPPHTLTMMRISGETQIQASEPTKNQMIHEGRMNHTGVVKVCVSKTGSIMSASMLKPTGYPAYNERLVAGVRGWRYRPHIVNGVAVDVCGTVTFHYHLSR